MSLERLHKVMAACGVGSRRACEEMIAQGRVEVDGRIVTEPGTKVDLATQVIRCDGELVRPEPPLYYLLNKPRGAICSTRSAPGGPRAIDYLPARGRDRRVFTVGRLDVDSDGALILTNDGELTHELTHPSFGVEKTYRVEVDGHPDDATLEKMGKGVWLAEGRTGELDVGLVHRGAKTTTLIVRLNEGKKREIRRVCARFGHEVRRLTRLAIGPVELGSLKPGEIRALTHAEVAALRASARAVIRLGAPTATPRGTRRKGGLSREAFRAGEDPAPRGRAAGQRPAAGKGQAGGQRAATGKGQPRGSRGDPRPGARGSGAATPPGAGGGRPRRDRHAHEKRAAPPPRDARGGGRGGRPGRGRPEAGRGGGRRGPAR